MFPGGEREEGESMFPGGGREGERERERVGRCVAYGILLWQHVEYMRLSMVKPTLYCKH